MKLADLRSSEAWPDWAEVLACVCPEVPDVTGGNSPKVSTALGSSAPAHPPELSDVSRVFATALGKNDGPDWLIVFRTHDGRYFYVEAGCDYTGWDCQSGGHAIVSHSLTHLKRFGLTDDARTRLEWHA